MWEEGLTRREKALIVQEEKAWISEKALVKASVDLDAEQAKIEATRKEYLNKMEAHSTRAKHYLGLEKMLGRRMSSSMGEGRTWTYVRQRRWRHSPGASAHGTTLRC
jgi:hypothetical protein